MSPIKAISKTKAMHLEPNKHTEAINVSSYGEFPFNELSPFSYSIHYQIPVPGMPDTYSHSVEGIWQGLKVIDGMTDFDLFDRRPRKRKGDIEGHLYNGQIIGLLDARMQIFVPSYEYYLDNYAPKEGIECILDIKRHGKTPLLYDTADNLDITAPGSFAHASILALYLNIHVDRVEISPRDDRQRIILEMLDRKEDLGYILTELASMNGKDRRFLSYVTEHHPRNLYDYFIGQSLRAFQSSGTIW